MTLSVVLIFTQCDLCLTVVLRVLVLRAFMSMAVNRNRLAVRRFFSTLTQFPILSGVTVLVSRDATFVIFMILVASYVISAVEICVHAIIQPRQMSGHGKNSCDADLGFCEWSNTETAFLFSARILWPFFVYLNRK